MDSSLSSDDDDCNQIYFVSDVHHDVNGVPQKFRHQTKQRKKILRRKSTDNKVNNAINPGSIPLVKLSSKPVKAAVSPRQGSEEPQQTHLVYVGKLSQDTTDDDHRAHIIHTSVEPDDIADIMKLRSQKNNESFYCLYLNTEEAESLVFNQQIWAPGIRVCSLHPRQKRNSQESGPRNNRNTAYPHNRRNHHNRGPRRNQDSSFCNNSSYNNNLSASDQYYNNYDYYNYLYSAADHCVCQWNSG